MEEPAEREPPCYTDLSHGPDDTGATVEDQVVVTMEEVDQAITRNAPDTDMSRSDMKTIKRLTETVLKHNVREQGVPPTELQREITIAHVVTNLSKTKLEVQAAAVSNLAAQPTVAGGDSTNSVTARAVLGSSPAKQSITQRVQIGVWTTISSSGEPDQQVLAYADQVPKALACMVVWLIVTFFIATPLTLLWTAPALNGIVQVKRLCLINLIKCPYAVSYVVSYAICFLYYMFYAVSCRHEETSRKAI